MSHWTYQPNGLKTVPLKIHCPRSPVLGGSFANGNCNEMTPSLWEHNACHKDDYVDGRGYIFCECDQDGRCIFDCRFQCGTDKEYYSFSSYHNILTANSTIMISMTGSHLSAEERGAYAQWVLGMNSVLT